MYVSGMLYPLSQADMLPTLASRGFNANTVVTNITQKVGKPGDR